MAISGTINVTISKFNSTAQSFSSTGKNIKNVTTQMTNLVNQMTGKVWSGEAANSYKKKFNELQDDINRMVKMIEEHVSDLQDMAKKFQNAEDQAASLANALAGDVIQ